MKCNHECWITSPGIADPMGLLIEGPTCPTDGKHYVSDFDFCWECKRKINEKEKSTCFI